MRDQDYYESLKEIRDIKIDLVMGNKNPIVDLFREITDGLKIINCNVYNEDGLEFIYHNKDGEWIFYQDVNNVEFWANYKRYWEILEREFDMEYEEIQALTKFLVEEVLKREVTTPLLLRYKLQTVVEEALNREVGIPHRGGGSGSHRVEEVLKREVGTPYTNDILLNLVPVEEALKRKL